MARTPQTEPGDTTAPQTDPDSGAATVDAQTSTTGGDALQTLALTGDEAARRALGLPTAGAAARDQAHGLTLGQPAPRTVYLDGDGNVTGDATSSGDEPFRGTLVVQEGQTVTAAALALLPAE